MVVACIALTLSVLGIFHFSVEVLSFSHEETLDIESKMKPASGGINATMHAQNAPIDGGRTRT